IHHAPLSRRSTVPTPHRDTCNIPALIYFLPALIYFFPYITQKFSYILSSSCFAVCGHHVSPSVAIVFSLLSNASNIFMPPFVHAPHFPPLARPVPPCREGGKRG
ncbi:unnamed protein product, partial [Sphacelaria rigidula]